MYQAIQWEVREHIGILRLNRPERLNAIDNVMRNEMEHVLRAAEADPDVWTIIATGNGRARFIASQAAPVAEAQMAGSARRRGAIATIRRLKTPADRHAIAQTPARFCADAHRDRPINPTGVGCGGVPRQCPARHEAFVGRS